MKLQYDDVTSGFDTKTKSGFRIKSGLVVFIENSAKEFRKSIMNENGLTRGDAHLEYFVEESKILILKSKMAPVWKLPIYKFLCKISIFSKC